MKIWGKQICWQVMKSCYASCDLCIYCFTVTSISVVILCYHKDKPDGVSANTPHNMSDYTNYANNGTVNTAPLTVQMLNLSSGEGWVHSGTLHMSFVSFMSLLKCLLSHRSACSISCLSTVKKHIYHSLCILYRTHNSADSELTPCCWDGIILIISVPKSASQMTDFVWGNSFTNLIKTEMCWQISEGLP